MDLRISTLTRPTEQSQRSLTMNRQFADLPGVMLAKPGSRNMLNSNDHIAETKWDGTRVLLVKRGDVIRIFVARGKHNEYTHKYKPLINEAMKLNCKDCILDGEFLFFDHTGRNHFLTMSALPHTIGNLQYKYVAFDILDYNGRDVRSEPLESRKRLLSQVLNDGTIIKKSQVITTNIPQFFNEQMRLQREGIILKEKGGVYVTGRSSSWLKIKKTETYDVAVRGFTEGINARNQYFGALKCYIRSEDGGWRYVGDVGSGFNNQDLQEINPRIRSGEEFVIEVKFMEWTRDGRMRHPVFLRVRDDKSIDEL